MVMCASGAQEALDLLEEFRPDVLISDVGMPDIDGFEFIEQLRRLPREQGGRTPAIALTAMRAGRTWRGPRPRASRGT